MASWDSTIFNHQRVWDSRGIQQDFIIRHRGFTSRAGNDVQGGQKPWVDEGFGLSSLSFGQSCRLEKSLWIMRWAETFPRLVSAWNVQNWLVVWNKNFIFPIILGKTLPFDFHIFQRGRSTTNQKMIRTCYSFLGCGQTACSLPWLPAAKRVAKSVAATGFDFSIFPNILLVDN